MSNCNTISTKTEADCNFRKSQKSQAPEEQSRGLAASYLTLRKINLHACEEWKCPDEGLSCILIRSGNCAYTFSGKAWDLSPGDVVLTSSHSGGKIQGCSGELEFWYFSFLIEYLFPLLSVEETALVQDLATSLRNSKRYSTLSSVARKCHELLADLQPEGSVNHRGQVLRIAAVVLSAEFCKARTEAGCGAKVEARMSLVFASLSQNDLLTLSVDQLAKRFTCTRRHLNRLFHRYFGVPVTALRLEIRLLSAVSLLKDTKAKINEVSAHCGFTHQSLFYRHFKKRFGSSPERWRQSAIRNSLQLPPSVLPHRPPPILPVLNEFSGMVPMAAHPAAESKPLYGANNGI